MNSKSIYEILENVVRSNNNELHKIISIQLIEDIGTNNFKTVNELANSCFCSISSISKFASSLGFGGYKELLFLIKLERKHYKFFDHKKSATPVTIDNIYDLYLNKALNFIRQNSAFINKICEKISEADNIFIFTSHQTDVATKYFYEILVSFKKQVIVINPAHQLFDAPADWNTKKVLNIFLVSGRDNDTIINFLVNRIDFEVMTNFLITTSSQINKIKLKTNDKLIIDFEEDIPMYIYRNMFYHLLFFTIFETCRETFF